MMGLRGVVVAGLVAMLAVALGGGAASAHGGHGGGPGNVGGRACGHAHGGPNGGMDVSLAIYRLADIQLAERLPGRQVKSFCPGPPRGEPLRLVFTIDGALRTVPVAVELRRFVGAGDQGELVLWREPKTYEDGSLIVETTFEPHGRYVVTLRPAFTDMAADIHPVAFDVSGGGGGGATVPWAAVAAAGAAAAAGAVMLGRASASRRVLGRWGG